MDKIPCFALPCLPFPSLPFPSLILFPGKVVEQLIQENISRHVRNKKIIRSSQQREACLTNSVNLYDEPVGLVIEGRAADTVYLDFGKTFDSVL